MTVTLLNVIVCKNPVQAIMANLLDIPFFCLPFMVLVNLTVLSKECHQRSKDALKLKDRGNELITYFKSIPLSLRETKTSYMTHMDIWHVWMKMASKVFPSSQPSFVFMRPAPCSVDVCTTLRDHTFNMEVSTQHSMDLVTPQMLFASIENLLQPSLAKMIDMLQMIMTILLGAKTVYDEVWWRTSPITFYEVDLVHNVYYQYVDAVITCIDGTMNVSIEHRRTRVAPSTVRQYLPVLMDFVK